MHLLVTRPEADGARLKSALEASGHRVTLAPLITIELSAKRPDLRGVAALVATSRNGVRALVASGAVEEARRLPIYVVGPATGELARKAGFATVIEGPAAGRDLARLIVATERPGATLLHLAGDKLAYDLPGALEAHAFPVRQEVVYRSVATEALNDDVATAIRNEEIDGVILMSPRTAKIFSDLIAKAELGEAACRLCYFCLSEAVAENVAALAPTRLHIARLPNQQELLALVARVATDFA